MMKCAFYKILSHVFKLLVACILLTQVHIVAHAVEKPVVLGYYISPDYFELESSTGRFSGFLFDYMESLSNYLSSRVEYQQCELSQCTEFLDNGTVDVIPVVVSDPKASNLPYDVIPYPVAKAAVFFGLRHGRASLFSSRRQKIGYVAQENSETKLRSTLLEKGFHDLQNLVFIRFKDTPSMISTYRAGNLDGMIIESMRRSVALPVVAELYEADVYLAVRKGDEATKEQLTRSMLRMHSSEPWLDNILNIKYFLSGEPLILTDEELNFLNRRRVIRAVATTEQEPYSYFKNGHHMGLLSDIIKIFEHDLGIRFEVLDSESVSDMYEMISNGQADVQIDLYSDYNWAREKNMRMTAPFLDVDYVSVTRVSGVPERPKVAAPYGCFFTNEYIEKRFPRESISYYLTIQDCLNAVSQGNADITFMKSLIAQTQIDKSGYRNLRTNGTVVFSHQQSIGVSSRSDPMLVRILNKEIAHIDKPNLRRLSNEIEFESLRRSSLMDLVYSYPLRFISVISIPLICIIALLSYLMFERRRSYRAIRHVYYTNIQTGLHNPRWFEERIPKIIEKFSARSNNNGEPFVMIVKVKHKDLLLKTYEAEHLGEATRNWVEKMRETFPWILECAVAAELEGVYMLGILKTGMSYDALMQDFERADRFFEIGGVTAQVHTVCGICSLKNGIPLSMSNVIVSAQMALDDASGRNRHYSLYDEKLEQIRQRHKRIEDLMEKALNQNEFEVWIQPKYAIRSRRIIGGEALVRWRSPELGFLQPGEFIPLFEKNGFVIELDYYMLSKVRSMQQKRNRDSKLCVPISVNQSGLHFSENNYLARMKNMVDKVPLSEGFVELEVTESAFFDLNSKDPRHNASTTMNRLRDMGYTFSMDDFSKGYSSVSSLLMLPMDTVKIDMDMLNAAMNSDRARKIFAGIVKLCRNVDIKVICEGVETSEQEQMLLSSGCNYGQGYAFSKPMPLPLFLNMLDRQQAAIGRKTVSDSATNA